MDRTTSTFAAPHTPVTRPPNALAICTAKVPTPPDAPTMSTSCPGSIRPWSRSPCKAGKPETARAAACSTARFGRPRRGSPVAAQPWQGGQAGYGESRRLLEGEVRRLRRELLLPSERVLGEGTLSDAEHLIAGSEPARILAD